MPDVTVLGAGGSTVTVPFTSQLNANAAQAALNLINTAVQVGLMTQVNYTGSGTIPSATGTNAPLNGLIATGSVSGNAGALPFGAIDVVTNSTAQITVVGPAHVVTVASGVGGITFGNQSTSLAKVYFGAGKGTYIGFKDAKAEIGIDGTGNLVWDQSTGGAVSVKSYAGSATAIVRGNVDSLNSFSGGTGAVSVEAQAGTSSFIQVLGGSATTGSGVGAMTISGAAGANISYEGRAGTSAFINPTSGNVTIQAAGAGATGAVTLAGTTAAASAFTGSATVFGGVGLFQGGTAGKNNMATSTIAGVTTLIGAGDGDVLFNNAANNVLRAGMGKVSIVGTTNVSIGGARFQGGNVGSDSTIFGNAGGGNSFFFGNGFSVVTGSNAGGGATVPGLHATANFFSTIASGGIITINDFISGRDQFSLTNSVAGGKAINNSGIVNLKVNGFDSTQVTLTDNTRITFYQTIVKTTDFT